MFCRNCGLQISRGNRFCKNCGTEALKPETFLYNAGQFFRRNTRRIIVIAVIILILGIIGSLDSGNQSNYSSSERNPYTNIDALKTQAKIASSVVNILCPDGEDASGGSGTIMSEDGLILTNAHIVPQDRYGDPRVDFCVVTLPDSQGKVDEVYYGEPILVPQLSNDYDLAFVQISDVFIDDDGVAWGDSSRRFPGFIENGCVNDFPRLGERIRVFGYPAISAGGLFLTVTEGLVSSLPNDGTIYISAKIDHGSSGGLAVDENGCMIGIPSMISNDGNETFGILISNDVVGQFMSELSDIMD